MLDGELTLEVIGDVEPGVFAAQGWSTRRRARQAGLLDHSGRFIPDEHAALLAPALAARLAMIGKERVFVLHWRGDDPAASVYLSQRDVRELQFAKASIATGWADPGRASSAYEVRHRAGAAGRQLRRVPVAVSAIRIGLVPKVPTRADRLGRQRRRRGREDRALLSLRERAEADCDRATRSSTSSSPAAQDFNDLFIDQLAFPG